MKTMLCLEDTYFSMAEKITSGQNALVICDRGTLDASAFISAEEWSALLDKLNLEESHICENRYDQVVHMVSLCNCVLIYFVARFYRLVGKHYSLQFLPATTSSLSRTLEGLFELTPRPFKGPRLVHCLRNYRDTRTPSRTTNANLDSALVKKPALVFVVPNIGRAQVPVGPLIDPPD